jgi:hypothetical protein
MMPITDGPAGSPADTYATVWDLAEGFAVLARVASPNNPTHASHLLRIATRMRDRARAIEREELADHLEAACQVLQNRLGG